MKQTLSIIVFLSIIPNSVMPEEKGDAWLFPPSGYFQFLSGFGKSYFVSGNDLITDYEREWSLGSVFEPAMVADKYYFYFRDTNRGTRVDRSTMRLEADGYHSYVDGDKRWLAIMGGGFFATNRLPSHNPEAFKRIFDHLSDTRRFLLEDKPEEIFNAFFDTVHILPQSIRSVILSEPFLEETIRGKRYRYDDDILLYRWFYLFLNRGVKALYFVNDPTPLVEGAPGNGTGLRIEVNYHLPMDNLVVLNGFVDMERRHLFRQNARMKRVLVKGEGFEFEYEFEDRVYFAQIDFPKKVERIELTVLEVYDGSRFEDLCISGLFTNPDIMNTRNKPFVHEFLKKVEKTWREGWK